MPLTAGFAHACLRFSVVSTVQILGWYRGFPPVVFGERPVRFESTTFNRRHERRLNGLLKAVHRARFGMGAMRRSRQDVGAGAFSPGVGFMLPEMAFLHRCVPYPGHPVYSGNGDRNIVITVGACYAPAGLSACFIGERRQTDTNTAPGIDPSSG
jgi:hypothetical protein